MSVVFLLFSLFFMSTVVVDVTESESCSAQSCVYCPSLVSINCTLTHSSPGTLYVYYCEAPSSVCVPTDNGQSPVPCLSIIQRRSGSYLYVASSWNTHPSGNDCNHEDIQPNCLGLSISVKSNDQDFSIPCTCHDENCAHAVNVTVFILPTTSSVSSSVSSTVQSSSTDTSSSILPTPSSSSLSSSINNFTSHQGYISSSNILPSSPIIMIVDSSSNIIPILSSSMTSSLFDVTETSVNSIPLMATSNSPTVVEPVSSTTVALLGVIGLLGFVLLIIIVSLIVSVVCYCHRYSTKGRRHSHQIHFHTRPPNLEMTQLSEPTPLPFQLIQNIGNGKFGSVWKALYNDQTVAVKIFSPHHKLSWQNERDIHVLDSTPHENILHFILGDNRGTGYNAEYFIITEYYPLGSLNYFLRHNSLSWEQAWNVMHSVSSGLAHLHSSSFNPSKGLVSEKYSIAHRDIKSSNVLIKNETGQCVLADLGLAFILDPAADVRKLAISGQVGTYRYMAPEALDARVNLRDIESFKQIDVYALALVLWEVGMRCRYDENPVQPYQSPYFDLVGEKPTLEQMKEVVVSSKQRPPISGKWYSNKNMKVIANFLTESWDEDPEARLTAANVIIQLENLVRTRTKSESQSSQPPQQQQPSSERQGQISETSQSSLCKKVRVSASFSGSSSTQPFVSPPIRFSVDHVGTTNVDIAVNIIQSLQDCHERNDNDVVVRTLPRIDSSSQSVYNEEQSTEVSIDATTGQHQTPTTNQCTTISDSTTHENDNM